MASEPASRSGLSGHPTVNRVAGQVGAVLLVGLSLGVAAVVAPLSLSDVLRYRRLRRM